MATGQNGNGRKRRPVRPGQRPSGRPPQQPGAGQPKRPHNHSVLVCKALHCGLKTTRITSAVQTGSRPRTSRHPRDHVLHHKLPQHRVENLRRRSRDQRKTPQPSGLRRSRAGRRSSKHWRRWMLQHPLESPKVRVSSGGLCGNRCASACTGA